MIPFNEGCGSYFNHTLTAFMPDDCFNDYHRQDHYMLGFSKQPFKVTFRCLTAVDESPNGIPRTHISNSSESKSDTGFFHSYVYKFQHLSNIYRF